ncbi:MAG: hypothetical protein QM696_03225 [Steroidobacteraceae bacterium]
MQRRRSTDEDRMRIGKPMMLVTTPVGLAAGVYEGYHMAGPVMTVAVVMILSFGAGIAWTVLRARREQRAAQAENPR